VPENIDYTPHESVVVNAVLCREVIEEKNGLITPVKLFEAIDYPADTTLVAEFYVVCVMKSLSTSEEEHIIGVHLVSSSGDRVVLDPGTTVRFRSSAGDMPVGAFHILTAGLKIPGPGVYWLEIWVDGKFGTRLMIFFRPAGQSEARS